MPPRTSTRNAQTTPDAASGETTNTAELPPQFTQEAAEDEFAQLSDAYGEYEYRIELYDDDADSKRGGRKLRTPVKTPIGTMGDIVQHVAAEVARAEKLVADDNAALVTQDDDGLHAGPRLKAARFLASLTKLVIVANTRPEPGEPDELF